VPTAPFSSGIEGTYALFGPDGSGHERIVFSMHLRPQGTPLTVTLTGSAIGAGLAMTAGEVSMGNLSGPVTSLDGQTVGASIAGPGTAENLAIELSIDRGHGRVTGSVSGTQGGADSGLRA
jgi:hypothetical protein